MNKNKKVIISVLVIIIIVIGLILIINKKESIFKTNNNENKNYQESTSDISEKEDSPNNNFKEEYNEDKTEEIPDNSSVEDKSDEVDSETKKEEYDTTLPQMPLTENKGSNFKIIDTTENCAQALEEIYEDDKYIYYFSCIKSQNIKIVFSNGDTYTLKEVLNNNILTIDELISNGLGVRKKATNKSKY